MRSLLVLDEDKEGRAALAKTLKQAGFHVYPAENETAALAALDSGYPLDLVIAGATDRKRTAFLTGLRTKRPSLPVIVLSNCSALSRPSCGFLPSAQLNYYMNTRMVEFKELFRMIRLALQPRDHSQFPDLRAA